MIDTSPLCGSNQSDTLNLDDWLVLDEKTEDLYAL